MSRAYFIWKQLKINIVCTVIEEHLYRIRFLNKQSDQRKINELLFQCVDDYIAFREKRKK